MKTYIDLFLEASQAYAERVSVVDCDGHLTYKELDDRSNALARRLPPASVLVMLPRRSSFSVAALGTMKAGGCYIPCSPSYPADRIRFMAEDSGAKAFITTVELWNTRRKELEPIIANDSKLVLIDQIAWHEEDCSSVNRSTWEQEVCTLYTSGTTGRPKGVVYTLGGLTAYVTVRAGVYRDSGRPVHEALYADFGFVASLTPLFATLAFGSVCHILDEPTCMDMDRLAAYLKQQPVDRLFLGSSMGVALLKSYDIPVKQITLGGEKVSGVTPEMVAGKVVTQAYGSSECIFIASHVITGLEGHIPVGRPMKGDHVYILDPDQKPVPQGTMGEIYLSSDHLAKGYRNLPELTGRVFLPDPSLPGRRMLRTGDLGYIDPAGELVCCGRVDNMVKIRGQRIEPGEVENVALLYAGVSACACVKQEVNGQELLCLYFEADGEVDEQGLRDFTATKLARYMVPDACIRIDELPRNARGKIDRKAMPAPAGAVKTKMVPPATEKECKLFAVVTRLLHTDAFGVTDDLRLLGLNSIMAMKVAAESLRDGIHVKAADLMKAGNLRAALQANMQMTYWWNQYDEAKPIVVFTHGIALTSNMQSKLDLLAQRFSVFVIENIEEHYHYLFEGESFKDVVLFYEDLLQLYLPERAEVFAFAGVSWGGILSYSLASLWSECTGQKPRVLMTDSLLVTDHEFSVALLTDTLDAYCIRRKVPRGAFNESFVRRATIVAQVESRGKVLPHYDGPVMLMNATKTMQEGQSAENVGRWRQLAVNLTVVDYDTSHDVLCVSSDYAPAFCQHLFDALGEAEGRGA